MIHLRITLITDFTPKSLSKALIHSKSYKIYNPLSIIEKRHKQIANTLKNFFSFLTTSQYIK